MQVERTSTEMWKDSIFEPVTSDVCVLDGGALRGGQLPTRKDAAAGGGLGGDKERNKEGSRARDTVKP